MSTIAEHATGASAGPSPELLAEVERASAAFENADASEVIAWSVEQFGNDLILASSFQDAVLIDLAVKVEPSVKVIFIDTGFHFPETLAYMRRLTEMYNLNLDILTSGLDDSTSPCGAADCCELRKVVPLNRSLVGKAGWITGVKRIDTPERANAPIASWDPTRNLVKINPMATWSDDDVDEYVAKHDLPRHPLNYVGYISIGCAPTTRPVAPGEDPRAGRWPDSDKTECGLHL